MAHVTLRVLHGADRGRVFERLPTPVTIGLLLSWFGIWAIVGQATSMRLIDRVGADKTLKPIISTLIDAGCEIRGDEATRAADPRVKPATDLIFSATNRTSSRRLRNVIRNQSRMVRRLHSAHQADCRAIFA